MKYVLLLPALAIVGLFILWPLGEMIAMSFTKTNYITSEWVGLKNYVRIFTDPPFLRAIKNSGVYFVMLMLMTVGLSLTVVLLVCDQPKGWHDAIRIITYVPMLAAGVVMTQVWKWIYHMEGPLNWFIGLFGLEPVRWVSHMLTGIFAVCSVVTISGLGGLVIILLASALSIDQDIYDAANIDGASHFQVKTRIIIPAIAPMILLMALIAGIAAPQIFETVYVLAPYEHASTIGWKIYLEAFIANRHGTAAAMSVALMVMIFCMTYTKQRLSR